jgi:peptide/nickel transport system substrate-binding protein
MEGSIRQPSRWLLLLAVFAVLAAACGGGGPETAVEPTDADIEVTESDATEEDTAAAEPAEGGTVVYGADQEPEVMNPMVTAGNLFATSIIVEPVLLGAYTVTPDFEYVPVLLDGEAEVTEDPFTVTYNIKDEAAWSDGTPITADDFIFTWQTIMNPDFDITSRDGYDKITDGEAVDDKTVKFTFSEVFAPYKTLFSVSNRVLPKHVLEGEDFDTVWNDEITIASGPFMFDSWEKGQQATIVRNEEYWGEEQAKIDELVFRFIEDSNTQVQALKGGEIDMFYPQPQVDLVEQVTAITDVEAEASAGTVWEHLDFNFAVPPLDQQYVRQAIFQAIDRDALASQLIQPINPEAEPLNNLIYVNNQSEYEPHFDQYEFDPAAAMQLLEENGCTKGADGIYTCNGTRLSFRYTTTAGNELRELQLQVIQQQLKAIGVEIVPATGPASDVFANVLPAGPDKAWDLFNFAWVGSPDPFGSNSIWLCGGDQNYNSYCNQQVTDLLNQTNTLVDAEERAATYNEADALMADDIPVVPLYQKPTFFAWRSAIEGPQDNPTQVGPTWNAATWTVSE